MSHEKELAPDHPRRRRYPSSKGCAENPAADEEVVWIGDGINDLEMLPIPEVCSVVIGQSSYPEVMASADIVAAPCDADPPGVARVLMEYLNSRA